MARVSAILKAVFRAFTRSRKSIGASATSHFFLDALYFLNAAGAFLFVAAGILLLFPLSGDPLRVIPPERLALWPLSEREHRWLRGLAPWLNWVTWAVAALVLWALRGTVSYGLLFAALGIFATGFLLPALVIVPRGRLLRAVPAGPGPLGLLLRKNLRQLATMLDVYLAAAISLLTGAYHLWGAEPLPAEAHWMITLLIVLVFSSHASALFGPESLGGLTRYRLLPVRGWQVLAMKDAALLLVIAVLSLPLDPVVAVSATLAMLAVGHAASVTRWAPQARWRFSVGAPPLTYGLLQLLAVGLAAAGTNYNGVWVIGLSAAAFAASLLAAGRQWDLTPVLAG